MWQAVVAASAAVLASVAVAVAGDQFGVWNLSDDDRRPPSKSLPLLEVVGPREFLYLDSVRADAYLSQLKGGVETLRKVTNSSNATVSGKLTAPGLEAGASATRQEALETSMSQTASSSFQVLWDMLHGYPDFCDVDVRPSNGAAQAAAGPCDWYGSRDVALTTFRVRLHKPEYVKAYAKLAWADSYGRLRGKGKKLFDALGIQPRLPLVADMNTSSGDVRVIVPVQAALISPEPTLYGGEPRLVARVVRRIDDGEDLHNLGFYARFQPLLWKRYAPVLADLDVDREAVRKELKALHPLEGRAAVLLPIAIFN